MKNKTIDPKISNIADELDALDAEVRVIRRSQRMMALWNEKPDESFPEIFHDAAELEAAYRFFNNPSIDFPKLIDAHASQTTERCKRHEGDVLCIHDTSTFVFSGERKGLGYINKNNRGFLGHFSFCVSRTVEDEAPLPLGVVAAYLWVRQQLRATKGVSQKELRQSKDCESLRWMDGVAKVEEKLRGVKSLIHVMDREGDIYDAFSTMVAQKQRFVIRALSNRTLVTEDTEYTRLFDAIDGLPAIYRESINVSARNGAAPPDQKKLHPPRSARIAEVCATACPVTIKRTRHSAKDFPATTPVNLVHVFEPNPPEKQSPVEWLLMTNEPIETPEDIRKVVAIYRQRWLIEEFFKAIKTGCAFEKRQLTTYHSLSIALAMTVPLAWEILLLRAQSRAKVSLPAKDFMSPLRIQLLRAAMKKRKRTILPEDPSLQEVCFGIASLGGHLKRNGPPGWKTLKHGYSYLLAMEEGWRMARETCDQS